MARTKDPLVSTVMLLEEIKRYPAGITSNALSKIVGRNLQGRLSKLYDYGVIDRISAPKQTHGRQFIYRTRLPKVTAPPAADVESESVASEPAGVE